MQWLPRILSIRCLTTPKNLCMSRRTSRPPVSHNRCRELVFGYITVLLGAFSVYQYVVLQNDAHGERLLQKHLLGETMVSRSFLS